jgi:hypothetical protein
MRSLLRLFALLAFCVGFALPAQAAVTITFWSHELGNSFPHAFFTLRGVPAKSVTPALLFGPVAGKLDIAKPGYMNGSDAQFSVVMTDAQYGAVLALVDAWSEGKPDGVYRLSDHNCVTFVREAARLVGLKGVDQPQLMKKPRSYLKAVLAENAGRVTVVNLNGRKYFASLGPIVPAISSSTAVAVAATPGIVVPAVPQPLSTTPR